MKNVELTKTAKSANTGININGVNTFPFVNDIDNGHITSDDMFLIKSKSGSFKSGFMQNLCLYASTDKTNFETYNSTKPCIVFVSFEMRTHMLLTRELSWMDDKFLREDIANKETPEVIDTVLGLRKTCGLNIPVFYIEIDKYKTPNAIEAITEELQELEDAGYNIILTAIDYVGNIGGDEESSVKLRSLNTIKNKFNTALLVASNDFSNNLDTDEFSTMISLVRNSKIYNTVCSSDILFINFKRKEYDTLFVFPFNGFKLTNSTNVNALRAKL